MKTIENWIDSLFRSFQSDPSQPLGIGEKIFIVVVALIVLALVVILIILIWGIIYSTINEKWSSKTEVMKVEIVDKFYQGAQHSSGTGVGIGLNGSPTVISTSSSSDEDWSFAIKNPDGSIETLSCTPELFYKKKVGDKVEITNEYGCLSKEISVTYISEN